MTVRARCSSAYLLFAAAALVVSIACAAGSAHATGFTIESIAQYGNGARPSLALDAFGNPHVTYHDAARKLAYALKSSGVWTIETVDTASYTGEYSSLQLDADGNPHVAYRGGRLLGSGQLVKYAWKAGGVWSINVVQRTLGWDAVETISLELDARDWPHVAYSIPFVVKYARKIWTPARTTPPATGGVWTRENVEAPLQQSWDTSPSLALDSQGGPHVTYLLPPTGPEGEGPYALRYARRTDSAWSRENADEGYYPGLWSSLVLDAQDNPHVSYTEGGGGSDDEIRYAWKAAGQWTIERVEANCSRISSMMFDAQGNPHVSYLSGGSGCSDYNLKYARRLAGAWVIEVVDGSPNSAGLYSSLALDADGNPHFVYFDTTTNEVKYAYVIPTSVAPSAGAIELMTISPNPSRGEGTQVFVRAPTSRSEIDLTLYDSTGRRIAILAPSRVESDAWRATWNGLDSEGRRIPVGIYWVQARTTDGRIASERLTVIR